jgi:hypothetical protein
MHALRYFHASTVLEDGVSVKALAGYLGHGDPGFTLRTYTHLRPTSEGRVRKAVDRARGWGSDGRRPLSGYRRCTGCVPSDLADGVFAPMWVPNVKSA